MIFSILISYDSSEANVIKIIFLGVGQFLRNSQE